MVYKCKNGPRRKSDGKCPKKRGPKKKGYKKGYKKTYSKKIIGGGYGSPFWGYHNKHYGKKDLPESIKTTDALLNRFRTLKTQWEKFNAVTDTEKAFKAQWAVMDVQDWVDTMKAGQGFFVDKNISDCVAGYGPYKGGNGTRFGTGPCVPIFSKAGRNILNNKTDREVRQAFDTFEAGHKNWRNDFIGKVGWSGSVSQLLTGPRATSGSFFG